MSAVAFHGENSSAAFRYGSDQSQRERQQRRGRYLEMDVLAYANSAVNSVYLVEVKSLPREESIAQIKSLLARFRDYFPEHKDKAVFGILAAVDPSADIRERALNKGLYVARIHGNVFERDTNFCLMAPSDYMMSVLQFRSPTTILNAGTSS